MDINQSIFELERRISFSKDFMYLLAELDGSHLKSLGYCPDSLIVLMNNAITLWPYRKGCTSIEHFASRYGFYQRDLFLALFHNEVEIDSPIKTNDYLSIHFLELIINLLHWIPGYYGVKGLLKPDDKRRIDNLNKELDYYFENIEALLEGSNLTVKELNVDGSWPKYIITKRNVDVDAAIAIVPDLADALLSFLDFRNTDNLDAKKKSLIVIANYLEPLRDSFKGTEYSSLSDDVFFAFNRLHIRHNNADQIDLTEEQLLEVYNQTFVMALHLLRVSKIKDCQKSIGQYKK